MAETAQTSPRDRGRGIVDGTCQLPRLNVVNEVHGALGHDAPGMLFQLGCEWLRNEQIFRPWADALSRLVAAGLRRAPGWWRCR